MDPFTIASSVTALLTPYLIKIGENFAEDIGKNLWEVITAHFKNEPASDVASKLETNASDPDCLEAFILQLHDMLQNDPEFAKEIDGLLAQARHSSNPSSVIPVTSGDITMGNVQIGGNVGGSFVVGHNNHVKDSPPEKKSRSKKTG